MGTKQTTIFVDGMTCNSCVARIEKALKAQKGVEAVKVTLQGGRAVVDHDETMVTIEALKAVIIKAGYNVRSGKNASTMIALGIGVILAAGYMIANALGIFASLPKVDASLGYGMLFVVGLLTSVHCVAMCGGIALSQSVSTLEAPPGANVPAKGLVAKLSPGLLYNGGRVLAYTIVGGIVGGIGAAFSFSPVVKGIIAAAAGLFMVVLGLKMLGILAAIPKIHILPAQILSGFSRVGMSLRSRGPFAVGALNGLMPCGPLQTMQLYALGTGGVMAGALSMFVFSIGTVPLMLAFGAAATLLPRKFVPVMVKASAVLVMFLGVITVGRAASLAGIALPSLSQTIPVLAQVGPGISGAANSGAGTGLAIAKVENGVQYVTTEFVSGYYVPFAVQAGIPVKWTIRVTAAELNGCNNPVTIPAYGIQKTLIPGDNVIEFTPKSEGTIGYTCWMGMISSRIIAVKDLGDSATLAEANKAPLVSIPGQGGGCCSGSSNPAFAGGKVPVDTIGLPTVNGDVQEITITVNAQGYTPAAIVLQKGMKAIIRFNPEQLSGCNNPIVFPEYNGQLDLARGQLETPPIPVTADFTFQCGMGMIHGYVKTVDDLAKVDINKVKAEIGAYKAKGGGGCCGG